MIGIDGNKKLVGFIWGSNLTLLSMIWSNLPSTEDTSTTQKLNINPYVTLTPNVERSVTASVLFTFFTDVSVSQTWQPVILTVAVAIIKEKKKLIKVLQYRAGLVDHLGV